jgi:hypothetical protein
MSHPIQELYTDDKGVVRFKANLIVKWLLDTNGSIDLNTIARQGFSDEDQEQFAQLTGYSLSGFGDLSYVSDVTYNRAQIVLENGMLHQDAEILALKERFKDLERIVSKIKKLTEQMIKNV